MLKETPVILHLTEDEIQALRGLQPRYSDVSKLDYFDIGMLPDSLLKAYQNDHLIAQQPVIKEAIEAVYVHDFDEWRNRVLRQSSKD